MQVKPALVLLPAILINTLGAALSKPEQYAYQAELSEATKALQRIELPVDILLTSTRADLGDVAVFDKNGKPVPIWLRKSLIPKLEKQFGLPVYQFNTYQQSSSKTLTIREQNQDQDQFSESTTTETVPVDQARQDYVIGLPEADEGLEIESIELDWTHQPADQLLKVSIEAGSDLDSWRTIQSNKSLTNQESDDAKWRTIDNIPKGEKYLRLTPLNSIRSFEIKQVIGTYQRNETVKKIWHQLGDLKKMVDRPGYYKFDMPSNVQAIELKLIPGEQQTLINGDLYAGREDFEQKRLIASNIQQHNISGREIEPNKSINIPAQSYVHWWFKPGQTLSSTPKVEISYPVYELLFLANDNGPFRLAWGNYESEALSNDLIGILSPEQKQQPASELVEMGKMQIAGGDARLSPGEKLPWLKWFLWLFLVVAVIITGNMAFNLFRDMNAQ